MNSKAVEAIYPLSPQQQGILFESLQNPVSGMHIEQFVYPLCGEVDLSSLQKALDLCLKRHSILRTCFAWKNREQPLQIVLENVPILIKKEDWQNGSEQQHKQLENFLQQDRAKGFKLSKPPLTRLTLLQQSDHFHYLVWSVHHILLDGWSVVLLIRDLFAYYRELRGGEYAQLPVTRPYRDYIQWLKEQEMEKAQRFWQNNLQGFLKTNALGIPIEAIEESDQQQRYAECRKIVPEKESDTIKDICRNYRITINALVQGIWAAILSSYSQDEDVVFGATIAGRPPQLEEIEEIAGLFINTLPLRLQVDADVHLEQWLREIQNKNGEIQEYQYCSSGQVHQWSEVPGSQPLYLSILVFENYPLDFREIECLGLKVDLAQAFSKGAQTNYPLTLIITVEKEIIVEIVHDTRRIDDKNASLIAGHFVQLLKTVAHDPQQKVSDLLNKIPAREIPRIKTLVSREKKAKKVPSSPRNAVEKQVAEIWAKVLGAELPGIRDNFFMAGGHSLLATQLLARLSEVFAVELPLVSLFEGPTVAELAEVIAEKQAEAKKANAPAIEEKNALPELVPDLQNRFEPFPLTEIQEAYWIGRTAAFALGNVATHGYFEIDCHNIDIKRLAQAWNKLIDYHDMLRVIFTPDGRQQALPETPFYEIELAKPDSNNRETQLRETRQRMSHQVLKTDQWPLFEIRATKTGDQSIRLHISLDALILDAMSFHIINEQWGRLYRDLDTNLPKLEVTFRDYVLNHRSLLESENYRQSRNYWLERIPHMPPAPDLPVCENFDSTHPVFTRLVGKLESDVWETLKKKAGQLGLTPSGVLLAAYGEVLATWSKEANFTINVSLFQRMALHPQINEIVGDFTSVVLLSIYFDDKNPFAERARLLQQQLWQDMDYSLFSGIEVLRELGKGRGRTSDAIMPVVFTSDLIQIPGEKHSAPFSWAGEISYSITQTPQVWIDNQVTEENGALIYNWDAVEGLFRPDVLESMFSAYSKMLHALAEDDHAWQRSDREHLLPAEQRKIFAQANSTQAPIPEGLLHSGFIQQVPHRYLKPAVVTSHKILTYKELYLRSLDIAHSLQKLLVRRNTLVAIVMEKSWEQIVAVLGILQAGAAYLPIDASLPEERIHLLLESGQVKIVLTQSHIEPMIAWPENIKRINVDSRNQAQDGRALEPVQTQKDLAYVIYTSGSTGTPKGVVIDHRGALNTVCDVNQRFQVSEKDRVMAISALNFDLSVYDIFGVLGAGGTIVLPDPGKLRDPSHWAKLIIQEKITLWNSVPALVEMLVEYLCGQSKTMEYFPRLIMMSGDWIPINLPQRIRSIAPDCQLISMGGATEASIWSIIYPIEQIEAEWSSIPYGKAMVNQSFYVYDNQLALRPAWVPGELYIGGIGVAKGYWQDKTKTDAAFFEHPRTGEKIYRTGDIGCYLPDGNIEFLGRRDIQVKVRGHRIELGEIEAVMAQHNEVRVAVAAAIGERTNKRLVAYVVAQQQHQADLTEAAERLEFKSKNWHLRQNLEQTPISLKKPEVDHNLLQRFTHRRTFREFLDAPVTLEHFDNLLACLMSIEIDGMDKYLYGSAGGLYPVQCYIYVKENAITDLESGIYYYHPKEHSLTLVCPSPAIHHDIHFPGNQPVFDQSAFSVFFIAELKAIEPMYGEQSLHYCILEAGLMSQLLEQMSVDFHIGLCQIGQFHFDQIRHYFSLEESHVLVHSLVGGAIDSQEASKWSPIKENTEKPRHALQETLQKYLKSKLPEYMVPSTFVLLDELPLTTNGKVDRNALPAPETILSENRAHQTMPRSEVERAIASVWQDVLNIENVGVEDNFFELGGTSVHMVQVHNQVIKIFEQEISIVDMFFKYSTIAALGQHLAKPATGEDSAPEKKEKRRTTIKKQRKLRLKRRGENR